MNDGTVAAVDVPMLVVMMGVNIVKMVPAIVVDLWLWLWLW